MYTFPFSVCNLTYASMMLFGTARGISKDARILWDEASQASEKAIKRKLDFLERDFRALG